jgi:hypothetical protein
MHRKHSIKELTIMADAMGLRLTLGALNYSSTPFGNAIEVIRISCASENGTQIDEELLVGANLRYFMFERSRSA